MLWGDLGPRLKTNPCPDDLPGMYAGSRETLAPSSEWFRSIPEVAANFVGATVQRLEAPRLVEDANWKFRLDDSNGVAIGFGLCSPAFRPDAVQRAVDRARTVHLALPPDLSPVVLLPAHSGVQDGLSWALYPYLESFSRNPIRRRWQYFMRRGEIVDWLIEAAKATRRIARASKVSLTCGVVADDAGMPAWVRREADEAIEALGRGSWSPVVSMCHNDFWPANVLLAPARSPSHHRFRVIDWGAATLSGFAVFDLLRAMRTFGIAHRDASIHLDRLRVATGGGPQHLRHAFIAAIGQIALDPGAFQHERLVRIADAGCRALFAWMGDARRGAAA